MTSMDNTPDSPAKTPEGYTTQGGNFWTLITPEIWKVLHAVLQRYLDDGSLRVVPVNEERIIPADQDSVGKTGADASEQDQTEW